MSDDDFEATFEEGDKETPAPKEEWKAPTKEEFDALVAERDKHKSQAERRDRMLREKKAAKEEAKPAADADAKEQEQWRTFAVNAEVRDALREAGFTGDRKSAARLSRMIDREGLEFDADSGEVDGLKDQIEELKEDFPHLFATEEKKADKKTAPRVKTSEGVTAPKKLTSDERLANLILGVS